MTFIDHLVINLVRFHSSGDEVRFYNMAVSYAAHAAREGRGEFARDLMELVDESRKPMDLVEESEGRKIQVGHMGMRKEPRFQLDKKALEEGRVVWIDTFSSEEDSE